MTAFSARPSTEIVGPPHCSWVADRVQWQSLEPTRTRPRDRGESIMHGTVRIRLLLFICLGISVVPIQAADPPPMKFNEVREVAPGVFFRYSAISATDQTVAFGGSNNIWIVFDDYVAVIDANFPKEAGDVIEAIKKTTNKPIRYVLDTHHHGDHAY